MAWLFKNFAVKIPNKSKNGYCRLFIENQFLMNFLVTLPSEVVRVIKYIPAFKAEASILFETSFSGERTILHLTFVIKKNRTADPRIEASACFVPELDTILIRPHCFGKSL